MGTNFTGITFDDCNVSPSDDGIINRTILPDGILSGCEISYSGSTLTMASGTLIACGRQFRHPAAQNWAVVDATTGYARLLITLDLTRSATDQTFDQVVDAVEYANDISGFPALVQQDLNAAGTKYQIVACVVSLGTGGISGIINTMPTVHPASADGGTLTVTAPAGSTVTATKDGKMLTRVAGADGVVVFRGLETGTWTLSITDGTKTVSKTVDIVADYYADIDFTRMLFANGDQYDDVTGGWSAVGWAINSNFIATKPSLIIGDSLSVKISGVSGNYSGGVISGNLVDVSGFNKLHVKINKLSLSGGCLYGGGLFVYLLSTNDTSGYITDSSVAFATIMSQNDPFSVTDLDIDAINLRELHGSYYIFLRVSITAATGVKATVDADVAEIKLEV